MAEARRRHAADTDHRRPRWNRGDVGILLCGLLAFLSITFGAPLLHQPFATPDSGNPRPVEAVSVKELPAQPVPLAKTDTAETAATPAGPPPAPRQQPALPQAAEPLRIRYPSADFDVPVHPLELDGTARASQTIVPPATKDGYWLTAFGAPGNGSANTTYVIGHSWDGAEAPFNHLSSAAAAGDRFEVDTATGTIAYRVESVTTYLKSGLKDSPVWEMVPNRLVLISCYTEDPWGKNVVVTAYPAAS